MSAPKQHRTGNPRRRALITASSLAVLAFAPAAHALTTVSSFGANPGKLTMEEYVPTGMPTTARPLVVALHGCTQSPDVYVAAGWNNLADAWKFYVLYPGTNAGNNAESCFNWGGNWAGMPNTPFTSEPLDLTAIARGNDENQSIIEMIDAMKASHSIDASRVFVTGLSAGGAMAAVMLADWPDVFAGGAIFAGIPYGCATNPATTAEASACMQSGGPSWSASAWGDVVRNAYPSYKGPYPRVSIWQGTSDFTVSTTNQTNLVAQWTNVHGVTQTPTSTDSVESFPHAVYKDATGTTVVETYKITGATHGTPVAANQPVDPASPSGEKCGQAGSYILDVGICSTYYAAKFFGLDETPTPKSPDAGAGHDAGVAHDAGIGHDAGAPAHTGSVDSGSPGTGAQNPGVRDGGVVFASSDAGVAANGATGSAGGTSGRMNETLGCTLATTAGTRGPGHAFALMAAVASAVAVGRRRLRRRRSGT